MAKTPIVEIEFGGETRRLIFDFNAQAEIQEASVDINFETAELKTIRVILWAGLLADTLEVRNGRLRQTKKTLSELQVGELLKAEIEADSDYVTRLVAKITAARAAAEAPKPANPPVAAQPLPLTTSGPSAATISDSPKPISGG